MKQCSPIGNQERGYMGVFLLLAILLMLALVSSPAALACDACSNDTCTPGFSQGTYGCGSVAVECSWIGRLLGTCTGKVCSTRDQPPCDNLKDKKLEPHLNSAGTDSGISNTCPAYDDEVGLVSTESGTGDL